MADENTVRVDSEKMLSDIANVLAALSNKMDVIADSNAALAARVDSMEAKRCDDEDGKIEGKGEPEEVVADRKDDDDDMEAKDDSAVERGKEGYVSDDDDAEGCKADDDDEKEAEKMADAAKMAQDIAALRAEIARLSARTPAVMADAEREKFAAIQEKADPAFQAFGDKAPAPLAGETPSAYKRRLTAKLQSHSPRWKSIKIATVADDALLDMAMGECIADAMVAARSDANVPAGHLIPVVRRSGAGHTIIEYRGAPDAWMNKFKSRPLKA